jgi:hypothetical protein
MFRSPLFVLGSALLVDHNPSLLAIPQTQPALQNIVLVPFLVPDPAQACILLSTISSFPCFSPSTFWYHTFVSSLLWAVELLLSSPPPLFVSLNCWRGVLLWLLAEVPVAPALVIRQTR